MRWQITGPEGDRRGGRPACGCPPLALSRPNSNTTPHCCLWPWTLCRALAGKYMGQPGFLSFSGGFPHPSLFPFAKLSLTTTDGHTIELSGPQLLSAQQYNYALRG